MSKVKVYDPEELVDEFGDDEDELPTIGALAALGITAYPVKTPARDRLERDGAQIIDMSYRLLEWLGCPVDARDFVLIMEGISGGNYFEPFPMTDEQIGELSGLTTRTIRDKRKALKDWQESQATVLVGIKEKEFNRERGKYDPTEYHVVFIRPVAQLIRKAREITAFQKRPARILDHIDDPRISGLLDEFKDDLPIAESVARARKTKEEARAPKDDKLELLAKYEASMKRTAQKWSDVNHLLGKSAPLPWGTLVDELSDIVLHAPARFEAKQQKGRLKKRGKVK